MRYAIFAWILVVALPAHAQQLRYVVRTDPTVRTMDVDVCFGARAARRMVPSMPRTARALTWARDANGRALPVRRGEIDTRSVTPGSCFRYRLDLEAVRASGGYGGRFGHDLATSANAWLWRPARLSSAWDIRLRFDLPPGIRAAVPFPRVGDEHAIDPTALTRASFTALGRFTPLELEHEGARFTVVRVDDRDWDLDDGEIRRWLERAVEGVASVQGRFPVEHTLILLVPGEGEGVGFGMVRRGGGVSIAFLVGRHTESESELLSSWVTWHELSHLLLPQLPRVDAWFYEGIATYYQEVLRVRAGIQSPERAWGELTAGFARGAADTSPRTLAEESREMMQTRAFQRVYWSGTFFALEADVALRQRGSSLDAALASASRRWDPISGSWSSTRVCELWDEGAGASMLRAMSERYAVRRDFPDPSRLLEQLGVERDGSHVTLREAELSEIRDAIMGVR